MLFIAVADPEFLQEGSKIHQRARSARENLTATPPLIKPRPFNAARRVSRAFFDQKTC